LPTSAAAAICACFLFSGLSPFVARRSRRLCRFSDEVVFSEKKLFFRLFPAALADWPWEKMHPPHWTQGKQRERKKLANFSMHFFYIGHGRELFSMFTENALAFLITKSFKTV
jgi:hypothetical protein